MTSSPATTSPWQGRLLVLVGMLAVALNLRPAAVSVGPVLEEVTTGLEMGPAAAGLLTSLPVLAFAGVGALAPWLARVVGLHRTTLLSLAVVTVGLSLRAESGTEPEFLVYSLLALAGMATANVLLPSLVKLHFPDRIGFVTALYTTALAVGLTGALTLTVPISEANGSWRWGLGAWAVLALVAALPWLLLLAHDKHASRAMGEVRVTDVARTRLGLAMALLFGIQSMHAYVSFGWFAQMFRDAGFSPVTAGLLVGLLAAVSIPLSLWLPTLAGRREDHRSLLWAVLACYPVAYVGLMIAPHSLAVLWALLVGVGAAIFPLVLTLIGLRARTAAGTAALSGFTQSAGYLLAALGPFTVGVLYEATGGWTAPLLLMTALVAPMVLLAGYVGRPLHVEDQLRQRVTV
ncbi:CynX/NimT family MFS transporter [Nocardioides aestuarii]|uniref:MFS transporter n=1 Tax=Nocardioides aestuarii TaxID=252231 RepID=A0ABW4TJ47_9ACTN